MPSFMMEIETSDLHGGDGLPAGACYSLPDAHTITKLSCQSENSTGDISLNLCIGDKKRGVFGSSLTFALLADRPLTLGSPSSGGSISSWLNAIKPAESATQSTGADQPMYSNSPYIHFASGTPGDHLSLPATPFAFNQTEEFTIFIVTGVVTANSDSECFILGGSNSGGNDLRSCYGIDSGRRTLIDDNENQFLSNSHVPSGAQIRCISRRSTGNIDEYVDGTQTLTNDDTCDKEINFTYINNAMTRSGESGGGTLRLFEVLVYSESTETMGSTERQAIEGYLAYKWSLSSSLPSGHDWGSSDPRGTDYNTKVLTTDLALASGAKGKYNPSGTPSFNTGGGSATSDWSESASITQSVSAGEVVRIFPVDFDDVGKMLIKIDYT